MVATEPTLQRSIAEDLAAIIASADDPEAFAIALVEALGALMPSRHVHVAVFRGKESQLIKYWYRPLDADLSTYLSGVYDLDPMAAAVRGGQTGLLELHDVAPTGFKESALYEELYASVGILDELTHNAGPRQGLWVLAYVTKSSRFTSDEISLQTLASPVIRACLLRLADLMGEQYAGPDRRDPGPIDSAVDRFGSGVLTQKEQEVIHLILRGHNSESVSHRLDIAWNTVRGHRQRAYAKLKVTSQGELFFEFLRSLGLRGDD
jgi:DNA-binding CsgD family transcriptional regulator